MTIRRTVDGLIASVGSREDLPLLHADVDFDRLAAETDLEPGRPLIRGRRGRTDEQWPPR